MDFLLKLGLATIFGVILGVERELRGKPAGLKTHIVICVCSCLLTIVSTESARYYWHPGMGTLPDPMRLAAQIVSGIGFLGAGVILRKQNDVISGLTTAAMVWGTSGIGIAIGAGFFKEAVTGMLLVITSVEIIPRIIKKYGPVSLRQREFVIRVTIDHKDVIWDTIQNIKSKDIKVESTKIKGLSNDQHFAELWCSTINERYISQIYGEIIELDHIVKVELESL